MAQAIFFYVEYFFEHGQTLDKNRKIVNNMYIGKRP